MQSKEVLLFQLSLVVVAKSWRIVILSYKIEYYFDYVNE